MMEVLVGFFTGIIRFHGFIVLVFYVMVGFAVLDIVKVIGKDVTVIVGLRF